jgi:type II secretory pathway pseudopilin PulG
MGLANEKMQMPGFLLIESLMAVALFVTFTLILGVCVSSLVDAYMQTRKTLQAGSIARNYIHAIISKTGTLPRNKSYQDFMIDSTKTPLFSCVALITITVAWKDHSICLHALSKDDHG